MPLLNPCPICGKQPATQCVEEYRAQYKLFCGVHVSVGEWFLNTEAAEKDWNRRTTDPMQPDLYKPTNADRIRAMSDEELAVFMRDMMDCVSCRQVMSRHNITCTGNYNECVSKCKEWVLKLAEEE